MAAYIDTEALLIGWLKTVLGYKYVSDELPKNLVDLLRTDPVIVVERFGGADQLITHDIARLDVDVYANTRDGAKHHSELIRAALRTRMLGYRSGPAVVAKVETISAPIHAPYDSQRAVRRFVGTYQITVKAFQGVS